MYFSCKASTQCVAHNVAHCTVVSPQPIGQDTYEVTCTFKSKYGRDGDGSWWLHKETDIVLQKPWPQALVHCEGTQAWHSVPTGKPRGSQAVSKRYEEMGSIARKPGSGRPTKITHNVVLMP